VEPLARRLPVVWFSEVRQTGNLKGWLRVKTPHSLDTDPNGDERCLFCGVAWLLHPPEIIAMFRRLPAPDDYGPVPRRDKVADHRLNRTVAADYPTMLPPDIPEVPLSNWAGRLEGRKLDRNHKTDGKQREVSQNRNGHKPQTPLGFLDSGD
jgi:hypothetical protein